LEGFPFSLLRDFHLFSPGAMGGAMTAVDLFGVEGARRKSRDFQARSLSHLERFGGKADWLRNLVTEAGWKAS
jgi:hypothetical protein